MIVNHTEFEVSQRSLQFSLITIFPIEKRYKLKKKERKKKLKDNQITRVYAHTKPSCDSSLISIDNNGSNAINMLPLNLRLISKLFNDLLIHPGFRFHTIHGLKRLKQRGAIGPINSIRLDEPAFYGKQKN